MSYGINEAQASRPSTEQIFSAFMMWASHHLAYVDDEGCPVTYADLGYELRGPEDIFQWPARSVSQQLAAAVYLQSQFIADTVYLEVPECYYGTIQRYIGIKFQYRQGPVVMVLRKKEGRS